MNIARVGFRLLFMVAVMCAAIGAAPVAEAAPKASLVMDLRNGKVLYARSADRKLHPASLTKMMTLYLTFKAVRDGRLRLDQKVRVSRHAARQPASKLYLKAGQRVSIRSLIRATAIKSANDAAMVLAEAIGGSQKNFGRIMTREAKRLGMTNTRFKNPHGLTQSGHYSTARDMAKLGRHLFFDFPQYYNIFKRRSDTAAGKRVYNTNRLLSTYPGADGIKTGYTRAAGYNLAASAHRGSKRILAVQFGANSSADRARRVARLLDIGFSRAAKRVKQRRPYVQRARTGGKPPGWAPLPRRKPGRGDSRVAGVGSFLVPSAAAATVTSRQSRYAAPVIAELPVPRAGTEIKPEAKDADPFKALSTSPTPPRKRLNRLSRAGNWSAEIGPYGSEPSALADLAGIKRKPRVGGVNTKFRVAKSTGRVGKKIYKLKMSGLSQRNAYDVCGVLLKRSLICRVVPTR